MSRFIYDGRLDAFVTPEEYYRDDTPYDYDNEVDECGFAYYPSVEEDEDELRDLFSWDYQVKEFSAN